MSGVEVYRLRLGRGNQSGGGSGGDWRLYEDRVAFEADVLRSLIEADAHGTNRGRSWAARWWLKYQIRGCKDVEHTDWTTSDVYAAEQLVDGEWVDLQPTLVRPSIAWGAVTPLAAQPEAGERP